MSIIKKLTKQLKKAQEELTTSNLSLPSLEKLNLETKKAFDEATKYLIAKGNLLKKIDIQRNYLKLWKHKGKQITIPISWRYLLSAPFIYGMMIPAITWNIGVEIYHQICFRLYGIPLVDSKEYFIYDRQLMSYLTTWEKINCYYCSYVNNLIRYSGEISGRTERYWCPIKYERRINKTHSQYVKFISQEDKKTFRKDWSKLRDFSDVDTKNQ